MKSLRQWEASSSDSTGTEDNVLQAHFALISSKRLLAHVFAQIAQKESGHSLDNGFTFKWIAISKEVAEVDRAILPDSECLVLQAL